MINQRVYTAKMSSFLGRLCFSITHISYITILVLSSNHFHPAFGESYGEIDQELLRFNLEKWGLSTGSSDSPTDDDIISIQSKNGKMVRLKQVLSIGYNFILLQGSE